VEEAREAAEVPGAPAPRGLRFGADELRQARLMTARWAAAAGLEGSRADDFVIAVNEIATNAIVHGSPRAWLLLRVTSDGAAEAEVRDSGRWLPSRVRPAPIDGHGRAGGMGLPLARRVCDDVEIRSGQGGTTVTLRLTLRPRPPRLRGGGDPGRRWI
jgi:anti-sigma regulatory factor (Ser/Thr protein kinase)